jgi:hypothetical protein
MQKKKGKTKKFRKKKSGVARHTQFWQKGGSIWGGSATPILHVGGFYHPKRPKEIKKIKKKKKKKKKNQIWEGWPLGVLWPPPSWPYRVLKSHSGQNKGSRPPTIFCS